MINQAGAIGITFVGASEILENPRLNEREMLLDIEIFGTEYLKLHFLVIVIK